MIWTLHIYGASINLIGISIESSWVLASNRIAMGALLYDMDIAYLWCFY